MKCLPYETALSMYCSSGPDLDRHVNARKQVRDDVLKELYVSSQQLGQVAVFHGPDEHHIFSQVWLRAPEAASQDER